MSAASTHSPSLGLPKQPIVAPPPNPGMPPVFDEFDESERATSGAILAILLTMLRSQASCA